MPASREDIKWWLYTAKEKGATHLLVVCDTFDWDDYPVYVMPGEDAHKIAKANNGPNMTKLMEVYNMTMRVDQQMAQHRAFNF